jgi:uncharacterized DUF497 family protein
MEKMKEFRWDFDKNEKLRKERNLSFLQILFQIENGYLIDIIKHPNEDKYPSQKMFIIKIEKYIYLVPFLESEKEIFLKTIIPSRKATKEYLGIRGNEHGN